MKRGREADIATSEIRSAIEELSLMPVNIKLVVTAAESATSAGSSHAPPPPPPPQVPLKPFISVCNLLVQVLDKIGPTMAVLRQDIHQNMQRLESFHDSDPSLYWDVVEILKKEMNSKQPKKNKTSLTCSKAFVWLTRSLDLTLALLDKIVKDLGSHNEIVMHKAVEEAYDMALKPWHGWISSAAFKIAIKLVPDSQTLFSVLKAKDEQGDHDTLFTEEIPRLISLLAPLLDQIHEIMVTYGLDKLKST